MSPRSGLNFSLSLYPEFLPIDLSNRKQGQVQAERSNIRWIDIQSIAIVLNANSACTKFLGIRTVGAGRC